ncbi:MAG: hypothetical protein ACJ788_21355 [Ktedonobacteraceae bacterium]
MFSRKIKQLSPTVEPGVAMNQDAYAVDLFRRAVLDHDMQARQWVQRTYHDTAIAWLRAHINKEIACQLNSEEFYVAQAFERLWQVAANQHNVTFATLPEALQYLRASLNSVLVEDLRAAARPATPPTQGNLAEGSTLWETLCSLLQDVREQRLAYLLYNCGLEPRAILQKCPQEFCDLQEILRLRRKILVRLMNRPEALNPWLENGQLQV